MKVLNVTSSRGKYPVVCGAGVLRKAGNLLKARGLSGKIMIVTQKRVARFHLKPLRASLGRSGFAVTTHFLPEGERAKSEKELFRLHHVLIQKGFERRDVILALGGGVAGDLAGFAAATYLRGISFVNIGTTLLAQVDSSIGGKTGINLSEGKNLVGAFYPPKLVISDVATLGTLPPRELRASLAEVVKYGIIRDAGLFRRLEKSSGGILDKERKLLAGLVAASAHIKAEIVGRDEYETGRERMILNYGHTFGHAFEQCLGYRRLLHGEAVAVGMVCAARLAVTLKLFSPAEEKRQYDLLRALRLPVSLSGLRLHIPRVMDAMQRDKKKRGGRLQFVLPVRIGGVVIKNNVPLSLVQRAIRETSGKSKPHSPSDKK